MNHDTTAKPSGPSAKPALLVLGALGVVYGDIGTSPLYAINQLFFGRGSTGTTPEIVYGGVGLVVWALTIIVAIKYIIFVLAADHDNEGGVFALLSLINKNKRTGTAVVIMLLILAAGLLFGDGMITPAISVISAVEGLEVATGAFHPYIIPLTIIILTALFAAQYKGTTKVGRVFGPVITLWFIVIASLGAVQIVHHPSILQSLNPLYFLLFLRHSSPHRILLVLGSVMLVITGGEALYADMGHFGKSPIRIGWFCLVYPALLLNYLGQGAYLLGSQTIHAGNIFYSMAPSWMIYPLVLLATLATIIASQALISGGFSLASQAIGLGLFPRIRIVHTHEEHAGQIYVPFINWILYAGCILLVVIFKTSAHLAASYGLAVSGVEVVTSLGMYMIARNYWNWSPIKAATLFGFFGLIEGLFLFANSLKFLEGGFIPLSVGLAVFTLMTTWQWGRRRIGAAFASYPTISVEEAIRLKKDAENLLPRSIVVLAPEKISSLADKIPPLLQIIWDRFRVMPKDIIFLTVEIIKEPYVHRGRYEVATLQDSIDTGSAVSVTVRFGFMENPNVERVLEGLARHRQINMDKRPKEWIIYALQERIVPPEQMTFLQQIRFKLFRLLLQNATNADEYFGLGRHISLSTEILPVTLS